MIGEKKQILFDTISSLFCFTTKIHTQNIHSIDTHSQNILQVNHKHTQRTAHDRSLAAYASEYFSLKIHVQTH